MRKTFRYRQMLLNSVVLLAALLCGCNEGTDGDQIRPDGDKQSEKMDLIKKKTAQEYPSIRHAAPKQVEQWLNGGKQKPLMLDVRESVEFEVSHLRGAVQVSPDASSVDLATTALKNVAKDQRIVLYCSVGVRSAAMAKRLQDAGYTNVHNMNGSIFQWANEGRAIYHQGEPADRVHPYNQEWGKLLKENLRADVPAVDD